MYRVITHKTRILVYPQRLFIGPGWSAGRGGHADNDDRDCITSALRAAHTILPSSSARPKLVTAVASLSSIL